MKKRLILIFIIYIINPTEIFNVHWLTMGMKLIHIKWLCFILHPSHVSHNAGILNLKIFHVLKTCKTPFTSILKTNAAIRLVITLSVHFTVNSKLRKYLWYGCLTFLNTNASFPSGGSQKDISISDYVPCNLNSEDSLNTEVIISFYVVVEWSFKIINLLLIVSFTNIRHHIISKRLQSHLNSHVMGPNVTNFHPYFNCKIGLWFCFQCLV